MSYAERALLYTTPLSSRFPRNCLDLKQRIVDTIVNRGTVPSLHTNGLRVTAKSSIARGHLALFSDNSDGEGDGGRGKSLGLASGGGGLAWQDGALQDVRLGGTTKLEGDLDLGGHRLLNFDFEAPDLEHVEVCKAHFLSAA